MSETVFAAVGGIVVPDDQPAVLATVTAGALDVGSAVLCSGAFGVGDLPVDATTVLLEVRRVDASGALVGVLLDLVSNATALLDLARCEHVCVDGPGHASGQVYVLVVTFAGASAPSEPITAHLAITYN